MRRIVRGKFLPAASRQKLVYNFLTAYSAEQNQVLHGSIFSSLPIINIKNMPLTHSLFFDIFIFTYGAYSSAVERQIVDLVVVGSIPTRHPSAGQHWICNQQSAFVAQLDRATDFESVGCRFETCRTQKRSVAVHTAMVYCAYISGD